MENITASEVFNFVQGSNITGESSFDVWKSLNPDGTAVQFIEHLRGDSSYEVWLNQEGNEGKTVEEYIQAMKVASSNYDFWLSLGYEGTPEDYLNFLKGKSAFEVWVEQEGNEGKTEEEFFASLGGGSNNDESAVTKLSELENDLKYTKASTKDNTFTVDKNSTATVAEEGDEIIYCYDLGTNWINSFDDIVFDLNATGNGESISVDQTDIDNVIDITEDLGLSETGAIALVVSESFILLFGFDMLNSQASDNAYLYTPVDISLFDEFTMNFYKDPIAETSEVEAKSFVFGDQVTFYVNGTTLIINTV